MRTRNLPAAGSPYTFRGMAGRLTEFVQGEFDYVRARDGSNFFLALGTYVEALRSNRRLRRVLHALESETKQTLEAFVSEQNRMIDEAKLIREALAVRAPEIDNSDMAEPDHVSHRRSFYDLNSFASFDRLAAADLQVGYPVVPHDSDDPGPVGRLLIILRGRFRAATFGEDAGNEAQSIRDDLDDLGIRIGNLGERHRASLQRYHQASRTLPGMAYVRLAYFGTALVADPVEIGDDADMAASSIRALREWGQPKTLVRKFVNGGHLEDWERRSLAETETTLQAEAERLNRELLRRIEPGLTGRAFVLRHAAAFAVAVGVAVVAGLILAFVFGVGR